MKPENEIGLRELFAQVSSDYGYTIIKSRNAFPDYLLVKDGQEIRAEAEYKSSNFFLHQHQATQCDLVVCWVHDYPLPFPVLELRTGIYYEANQCGVPIMENLEKAIDKPRKSTKSDEAADNFLMQRMIDNPDIIKMMLDYWLHDGAMHVQRYKLSQVLGVDRKTMLYFLARFLYIWTKIRSRK